MTATNRAGADAPPGSRGADDPAAARAARMPRTMWGQWLLRRILDAEAAQERVEAPIATERMRFEMRRKAFHVAVAILAVPILLFIPYWWAFALAAGVMLVITVTHFVNKRRLRVEMPDLYKEVVHDPITRALEKTRRPEEDFPWAPVTFGMALIAVASVIEFGDFRQAFAFAAFGILGIGDAASALIGVAYGRHRLQWNPRKSWEGTIAGVVASWLSAVLLAGVDFSVNRQIFPPEWFAVALAGAVAGAAIESIPKVQDNLFVPIGALAVMLGVAWPLGLL